MSYEQAQSYNDPANGSQSSIGSQIRVDHYMKNALIELVKEKYFSPLADTYSMPKHMGKKIRRYQRIPLLDDANINDQGIDAAGLTTTRKVTIVVRTPSAQQGLHSSLYVVGEGPNSAAALANAKINAFDVFKNLGIDDTDYATTVTNLTALAEPWEIDDTGVDVPATGNLYGSSKDIGKITNKLPAVGEHGGRVNRVGFTRIELTGTFEKFGFFDEYTKDSLMFDTDVGLRKHVNRAMLQGANDVTEAALQIDILNSAGVTVYAGNATATNEINGNTGTESLVTYMDLANLSVDLDDNRTPRHYTIIKGSRMVDTRVIEGGRTLLMGSELTTTMESMLDQFGERAFISTAHYKDAGNTMRGEIGSIGHFRLIVVPEMQHWAGVGADVTANGGYRETGGKYDVYPLLSIGDKSFTTIGFETSGNMVKFQIIHKKPSKQTADRTDPYGQTGFMSILWWYGFMAIRPERIAVIKTVARY